MVVFFISRNLGIGGEHFLDVYDEVCIATKG